MNNGDQTQGACERRAYPTSRRARMLASTGGNERIKFALQKPLDLG